MLFTYEECIEAYKNYYQMRKQIAEHNLFKIESGIYSNVEYVPVSQVIMKKYPEAVFTLNSAFYYQRLTDTIPQKYYIQTDKDASKITDERIKQCFDNCRSMSLGVETIKYNSDDIKVFSKERLLIELIRNRTKFSFDYYKEIIGSYRKLIHDLDFQTIEEFANALPKTALVMNTIQREVL